MKKWKIVDATSTSIRCFGTKARNKLQQKSWANNKSFQ